MSWTDAQARFADSVPGFEIRQGQIDTAMAIEKALESGHHLLVDAATGTGKSRAALVPAIEHAQETGKPVLIATETKALQDQYINVDVPQLQEYLDLEFTATTLKGLHNYVCRQKLTELGPNDILNQAQLLTELESPEHSGDVSELATRIDRRDLSKITMSTTECSGKKCPLFETCFGQLAKKRAAEADVVIINHHLLMLDVRLREASWSEEWGRSFVTLLPEHSAVIIDEAHGAVDVATTALGDRFTEASLIKTGTEVANFVAEHIVIPDELEGVARMKFIQDSRQGLLDGITLGAQMLFSELDLIVPRSERTHPLTDDDLLRLENEISELLGTLESLIRELSGTDVSGDDYAANRRERLQRRVGSLSHLLLATLTAESGDLVRWVDREWIGSKPTLSVQHAPLLVAPTLQRHLWSRVPCVLMSATLALNGDFTFVADQLGIQHYATVCAATPFDYPNQAAFYCPKDVDPIAAQENWRGQVAMVINELTRAAGGRSLLLFTSRAEMVQAWRMTKEQLEERGITVYIQDDSMSTQELGGRFKAERSSVLFALKTFWSGFDAKGDTCVIVLLNRLPFPVPTDPVFNARCMLLNEAAGPYRRRSHGGFPKLAVPSATLMLLQAFGRLIRSTEDRGLVVLMDGRVHSKPYGRAIRDALPPARLVTSLGEAVQYVQGLPY